VVSVRLDYYIRSVKLLCNIVGGDRIQSVDQELTLNTLIRDLDFIPNMQQTGITYTWSCVDLNTGLACPRSTGAAISLTANVASQTFPPYYLKKYTSLRFSVTGTAAPKGCTASAVITVTDWQHTLQPMTFPHFFLYNNLNINEFMEFKVDINGDLNPDQVTYNVLFLYQGGVVGNQSVFYPTFRIRILDYFSAF